MLTKQQDDSTIIIGDKEPYLYAWAILYRGKYHDKLKVKCMKYNEDKTNLILGAFRPWGLVEDGRETVFETIKKGKPKVCSIHINVKKLPEVKALRGG